MAQNDGPTGTLCGTHGWQNGRAWHHDFDLDRKVWTAPLSVFEREAQACEARRRNLVPPGPEGYMLPVNVAGEAFWPSQIVRADGALHAGQAN